MQLVPRSLHLMAGEGVRRREALRDDRAVDLLDGDPIRCEHRALVGGPVGHTDERCSCSQTVIRRGSGSWISPFSAKKPPPLMIDAVTAWYAFQRSIPPCASMTSARSLFI